MAENKDLMQEELMENTDVEELSDDELDEAAGGGGAYTGSVTIRTTQPIKPPTQANPAVKSVTKTTLSGNNRTISSNGSLRA